MYTIGDFFIIQMHNERFQRECKVCEMEAEFKIEKNKCKKEAKRKPFIFF